MAHGRPVTMMDHPVPWPRRVRAPSANVLVRLQRLVSATQDSRGSYEVRIGDEAGTRSQLVQALDLMTAELQLRVIRSKTTIDYSRASAGATRELASYETSRAPRPARSQRKMVPGSSSREWP